MENATKALLIAGGVLLAIMILSLLVMLYNNLVDYQQNKQSTMTQEQIAKFNKEYEAYNRDNVTGYEIVGLMNKILSYNALNTVSSSDNDYGNNNSDKAWTEMYIKFTIKDQYVKNLFKKVTYDSKKKADNDEIKKIQADMGKLETTYGAKIMNNLASLTEEYTKDVSRTDVREAIGKTKQSDTLNESDLPEVQDVKDYYSYVRFKRANFECKGTQYDNKTGRIIQIIFEEKL